MLIRYANFVVLHSIFMVLCIITLYFLYQVLENTKELKQKLKENIRNQSDLFKDGSFGTDKVRNL